MTGRLAIPIREARIDQGTRAAFSTTVTEVTIEPGGELRFTVDYAAPAISAEGIDGVATVEARRAGDYLCWLSRVPRPEFADHLPERIGD